MILPGLKSASLISIGQLCDDDCDVLLNKTKLVAIKDNKIILKGTRNYSDGLWDIPIYKRRISEQNYPDPSIHPGIYATNKLELANSLRVHHSKITPTSNRHRRLPRHMRYYDQLLQDNIDYISIDKQVRQDKKTYIPVTITSPSMSVIIHKKKTHTDLVKYLHAAAFSPVKSTFQKAIQNNHFKSWPGLTPTILKHLPTSVNTVQGHIRQEQQNLQSTKLTSLPPEHLRTIKKRFERLKEKKKPGQTITDVLHEELDEDSFPPSPTPNIKTNDVAYMVIDKNELSTAYTDLTGRFPCKSSSGNEYLLVAYHYDANCIIANPLRNRKKDTITEAWTSIHKTFTCAGVSPNTYVMDNEISQEFIDVLVKNDTSYQLVPPHTHRRNLAERAIQTWKSHFKAGLASVDPNFPLSEWDRLVQQANITLNLLRSARTNPKYPRTHIYLGNFTLRLHL